MPINKLPPALMLMGPTASGKSALAIHLAEQYNCEIISVDSALVYRGMDIGTAKPSLEERSNIKHHLIDILDPKEAYSTGKFKVQAEKLLRQISEKGKIPLLCGGTMLYFKALSEGLSELPQANIDIRQELQQIAERHGCGYLHQQLAKVDPTAAARIHPNDPQRIQRALEVYHVSGKTITQWYTETEAVQATHHFKKFILAPKSRTDLHNKIALRFNSMLQDGLLDEVSQLYQRGDLSLHFPAIRMVGYRQVWRYLEREYDYQTMVDKAIVATRQLAKRQFTWLRRVEEAEWMISEDDRLKQKVTASISRFLS